MSHPDLNCKHPDLIVQRNNGVRWVTCTECHTDFVAAREHLEGCLTPPTEEEHKQVKWLVLAAVNGDNVDAVVGQIFAVVYGETPDVV